MRLYLRYCCPQVIQLVAHRIWSKWALSKEHCYCRSTSLRQLTCAQGCWRSGMWSLTHSHTQQIPACGDNYISDHDITCLLPLPSLHLHASLTPSHLRLPLYCNTTKLENYVQSYSTATLCRLTHRVISIALTNSSINSSKLHSFIVHVLHNQNLPQARKKWWWEEKKFGGLNLAHSWLQVFTAWNKNWQRSRLRMSLFTGLDCWTGPLLEFVWFNTLIFDGTCNFAKTRKIWCKVTLTSEDIACAIHN